MEARRVERSLDAAAPAGRAVTERRSPPWLLAALSAALLLLDWAWFVRPGATYVSFSPEDFMQLADIVHRMASGQTPHVDFHAPLGWLALWLPYAGFLLQGGFAGALEAADLLMLAVLLPLACAVLAGRAPTWASASVLVALFGLVAAPWRMGEVGWLSDPGLHYNHWGWAFMTVALLLGLRGGRGEWRVTAVAAGVLLSLALFTKATHFLACLGFVVLFGAVLGEFRRAAFWGMGLCAACAVAVHAAGGWVDDYAADLARAARVALSHDPLASGGFTPIPVLHAALGAYGDVAVVLALGAAAALSGGLRPRTALHGLFALAAGVAALTQDAAHPHRRSHRIGLHGPPCGGVKCAEPGPQAGGAGAVPAPAARPVPARAGRRRVLHGGFGRVPRFRVRPAAHGRRVVRRGRRHRQRLWRGPPAVAGFA